MYLCLSFCILKVIFFFSIDCLYSPSKLYCYIDFLVKYWDKLIFLQMSASDLSQASFQLTANEF